MKLTHSLRRITSMLQCRRTDSNNRSSSMTTTKKKKKTAYLLNVSKIIFVIFFKDSYAGKQADENNIYIFIF